MTARKQNRKACSAFESECIGALKVALRKRSVHCIRMRFAHLSDALLEVAGVLEVVDRRFERRRDFGKPQREELRTPYTGRVTAVIARVQERMSLSSRVVYSLPTAVSIGTAASAHHLAVSWSQDQQPNPAVAHASAEGNGGWGALVMGSAVAERGQPVWT